MSTPIEQRKDILEVSSDLNLMVAYRKAIMEKMPKMWVIIHCNRQTNNYGLEVNTQLGAQCSQAESDSIREILRVCRGGSIPVAPKRSRRKKEITDDVMKERSVKE